MKAGCTSAKFQIFSFTAIQNGAAAIFAATPFLMMPEIYKPIRRYSTGTSWPSAPIFITSSSTPPTTS